MKTLLPFLIVPLAALVHQLSSFQPLEPFSPFDADPMSFKLLLTGATGTAGSEALRQAIAHPNISHITVLSRRPLPLLPVPDPKVTVILHQDFGSYPPALLNQLEGHDGVLWDLGISSLGLKEKEYAVTTQDYALAAARAFASLPRRDPSKKFVFAFLSGEGANQDEGKASSMFGSVKGRVEKALGLLRTELPIATYSFRPAGIHSPTPNPDGPAIYRFANFLLPVIGAITPRYVIKADVLAKGMLEAVIRGGSGSIDGWEGKGEVGNAGVFTSEEIKKLAGEQG